MRAYSHYSLVPGNHNEQSIGLLACLLGLGSCVERGRVYERLYGEGTEWKLYSGAGGSPRWTATFHTPRRTFTTI